MYSTDVECIMYLSVDTTTTQIKETTMSITSRYFDLCCSNAFAAIIEQIPESFWERFNEGPCVINTYNALLDHANRGDLADIGVHTENDIHELATCIVEEGF